MPHAALWVVQLQHQVGKEWHQICFNAARGFVGGATANMSEMHMKLLSFNAARGFVGGATNIFFTLRIYA